MRQNLSTCAGGGAQKPTPDGGREETPRVERGAMRVGEGCAERGGMTRGEALTM